VSHDVHFSVCVLIILSLEPASTFKVLGLIAAVAAAFYFGWMIGRGRAARSLTRFVAQAADPEKPVPSAGTLPEELFHPGEEIASLATRVRVAGTEVERMERSRHDLIANVSHELRTPLTSIHGYAETLAEDSSLTETQRGFVNTILRNTERMSRMSRDLLVLAQVEAGQQPFTFDALPAREIVEAAEVSFHELAKTMNVNLQVEAIAPRAVRADADAIQQVFSNLIENALKHSVQGRTVTIGSRESHDGVQFYVRDQGPGIAPEHRERIFERFYRVDSARSKKGGTGLGLAIAKHIVLAHGGVIRVESELGSGSTFFFILPTAR